MYPKYYREELKSIARKHHLLLRKGEFTISNDSILSSVPGQLPLHPNHKILYETILKLDPASILEIGCGGGDHLANLKMLNPRIEVLGYDRSQEQLDSALTRHPELEAEIQQLDITTEGNFQPIASLVFTQAVLMHISEGNLRFRIALENIFDLAENQIVLVENWTQHDFLSEVKRNIQNKPEWQQSGVYYVNSETERYSSALIVSKYPLQGFGELADYSTLLQGRDLVIH